MHVNVAMLGGSFSDCTEKNRFDVLVRFRPTEISLRGENPKDPGREE